MNLLNFNEELPTEVSCKAHFRTQREKDGIVCKGWHGTKHYRLKAK